MNKKNITTPCFCMNVKRASDSLIALYDRELKKTGLTVGQFSLLWNLDNLEKSNVTKLANVLGLDRTTVVRNLKPMLLEGVIRDSTSSSSRNRNLFVTEKGKAILAYAIPLWKRTQKKVISVIGSENITVMNEFIKILQKI